MICRNILLATAVCLVGTVLAQTKPNILFIHLDDMDFDEIGCFDGQGKVLTPNMDRIAREGMMFTRAYVNCAVCVPSRYSTLTGKYVGHNNRLVEEIPAERTVSYENVEKEGKSGAYIDVGGGEKTFAHYLKQQGYVTGMVGKYHNDRISLQRPYLNFGKDAADPQTAAKIRRHYEETRRRVQLQTGFDVVDRLYWENKEAFPVEEIQFDNTPWITEGAVEFIRRNKEHPFFLYYANPLPHGDAVNSWWKKRGEKNPHMHVNMRERDARATPAGLLGEAPSIQPAREEVIVRTEEGDSWGELTSIMSWLDDSIGVLLDTLDKEGLADNTLVVLLSDHQSEGKRTLYEAGVHVPMLVKWPATIARGSVCGELVCNIDLVSTFLEIAGGTPADFPQIDGKSIVPLLTGSQEPLRDSLLLEFGYARGVVSRNWKYIALRFPSDVRRMEDADNCIWDGSSRGTQSRFRKQFPAYSDRDQLFDLNNDPAEQENLFGNPEYAEVVRKMESALQDFLSSMPHAFGEFK